jgi:hypothetical protein
MGTNEGMPSLLYHYYEASLGPLRNLSDLPLEEAEAILSRIRQTGNVFASKRASDYLLIRRELEDRVRGLFIEKGGHPQRSYPHYFVLGECPWLATWYQDGQEVHIPLQAFSPETVSFTYGDTFPAMRYRDGKPYRGKVFTLNELTEVIRTYGLPQLWNPDGQHGPDRYIEAQVWSDEPLVPFRQLCVP